MSLQLDPETERYVRSTPKMSPERRAELLELVAAGRLMRRPSKRVEAARKAIVEGAVRVAARIVCRTRSCRLDPADALSEAMIAAYEAVDTFDPGGRRSFGTHLGIYIRRRLREKDPGEPMESIEGFDWPVDWPGFGVAEDARIVRRKVASAVLGLAPKRRSYVLRRFGLVGNPARQPQDIAREFGVDPSAVSHLVGRALADLRRPLADLDPAA